ncbi:PREDICTED: uncharacterized protein LOC109213345 [Nicotiana attenuata]|uniref:DUF4378 domain-containing protein n=1 Tax=Nicotiana attenuata TaxID=49451 RepID=A0A1J6KGU3_NICAT|nr:PREDICTED: uncharacterized protein LOC109213345 [Nicotiana attenuata]OIT27892.1 hypothetical protein A4A49_23080 [Nicotiana attenuata]
MASPSPLARLSIERRPKLLKDFLLQDDPYSCSYNDIGSHPRKLCKSTISNFHGSGIRSNKASSHQLLRSRSSRAATATISAINKVINIVKFLPFASVKYPSIFTRSISRKLSRRTNHRDNIKKHSSNQDVSVTVKVKDILRWKSFRDLVDEKSTPYSPNRCTTTATTNSTTTTSSKKTSWCDSDFTAEDLPSWWGENGEFLGELEDGMKKVGRKNIFEETVGGYSMGTTRAIKRDRKEELCFDENEQHSPVSVLESPFQEDDEEGIAFSFHRNLANLDKRTSMFMQKIQQFESLAEGNTSFEEEEQQQQQQEEEIREIEEKAKQLLSNLKETIHLELIEDCEANYVDELLFDFFWHELCTTRKHQNNDGESDEKLMREAKSWINGNYNGEFEWEFEDKRESYIRDMEREARWNKFEEEKQELSLDLDFQVFNDLVHEVLEDVFSHKC